MKVYTYQIKRDGEYVEQIGIRADNPGKAKELLIRYGFNPAIEDASLLSTE